MIKRLLCILIICLFATVSWSAKIPSAGVWDIWDNSGAFDTTTYPYLKGRMVHDIWSTVEPSKGNFNWSSVTTSIQAAVDDGFDYIMVKIYVGDKSPTWIYTDPVYPVTEVLVGSTSFPYYIETNYAILFKKMIDDFYDFILASPHRSKIVAVQCPIGTSGDVRPYGTPNDPQYIITQGNTGSSEWEVYQKAMFQYWYDKFKNTSPVIYTILHATKSNIDGWLANNAPNNWRKYARAGHCYQFSNMSDYAAPTTLVIRDEMDKSAYGDGKYSDAPLWFMYWSMLMALDLGADYWNIEDVNVPAAAINGTDEEEVYDFFNEYAGYTDESDTHGAWIAFKDSLDYADTSRFSEVSYGSTVVWYNQDTEIEGERYINIAAAHSAFGADHQDPFNPKYAAVSGTQNAFYSSSCRHDQQNDVGFDQTPGNYSMYLTQISPLTYDVGWWRVGAGASPLQPYGRYARGFDYSAGKNNIYLNIDDNFVPGSPTMYSVDVRIVYFNTAGSWSLKYNAVGDTTKTAFTQVNGAPDLNTWLEKEVTLTDTYFNDAGPQSADIWITNAGTTDLKFHMVEIERSTSTSTSIKVLQGVILEGACINCP